MAHERGTVLQKRLSHPDDIISIFIFLSYLLIEVTEENTLLIEVTEENTLEKKCYIVRKNGGIQDTM